MVLRAQLLVPRRRHAAPAVVAVDFAGKKPTKQPSRLPRCFKGQDIKDEGPAYALPSCFFYRWGFNPVRLLVIHWAEWARTLQQL